MVSTDDRPIWIKLSLSHNLYTFRKKKIVIYFFFQYQSIPSTQEKQVCYLLVLKTAATHVCSCLYVASTQIHKNKYKQILTNNCKHGPRGKGIIIHITKETGAET